jgi:hypothetical protein
MRWYYVRKRAAKRAIESQPPLWRAALQLSSAGGAGGVHAHTQTY